MAGMDRFLVAHFPPVFNTMLPTFPDVDEGEEALQGLLMGGPNYFSDVSLDDAVNAVAYILRVADRLFQRGEVRSDEADRRGAFERSTGMHCTPWDAPAYGAFVGDVFNKSIDDIRACHQNISSRGQAAKMSKERTMPLRSLPTADLFKKHVRAFVHDERHNPSGAREWWC